MLVQQTTVMQFGNRCMTVRANGEVTMTFGGEVKVTRVQDLFDFVFEKDLPATLEEDEDEVR